MILFIIAQEEKPMTINNTTDGNKMTLTLEGRLDTTTAPQLDTVVKAIDADIKTLTMDFEELVYLSSAGLRVILAAQKLMNARKGAMVIKNVNETIMEVFEITGFIDILTIE